MCALVYACGLVWLCYGLSVIVGGFVCVCVHACASFLYMCVCLRVDVYGCVRLIVHLFVCVVCVCLHCLCACVSVSVWWCGFV